MLLKCRVLEGHYYPVSVSGHCLMSHAQVIFAGCAYVCRLFFELRQLRKLPL